MQKLAADQGLDGEEITCHISCLSLFTCQYMASINVIDLTAFNTATKKHGFKMLYHYTQYCLSHVFICNIEI